MTIDQFLQNLQHKQILRQTDKQTLDCRIATLLTMAPPEKEDLSNNNNNKRIIKIGAFVQKLSMNKH